MAATPPGILRTAVGTVIGVAFGAALATQVPGEWIGLVPPPVTDPVRPTSRPLNPRFEGRDRERPRVLVRLVPRVVDVGQPTDLAFVPGHPDRLAVTSKWGSVHLVDLTRGEREFWIWNEVNDELECGVLGIAFHPDFESNGRFFVYLVPRETKRSTAVREFRVDPRTLRRPELVGDVFVVEQPAGTHNGGQIAFGPDGMLYVGLGDGSAGGDPFLTAQDRSSVLGSLLRLDVSERGRITVPPDNPFVGQAGVRPEIWAFGLRNPWRFTFDDLGRAIVGDVGQAAWEEVDIVQAGDNLGWSIREGTQCHRPPTGCPDDGFVEPIHVYDHLEGVSITGGVIWQAPGALFGRYLFGDFGTGRLWALDVPETVAPVRDVIALGRFEISPTAFTRDPNGGVWVTDFRSEMVFQIELAEP